MSSSLLKDRVIFLTGGAHGIGRECARLYADEGAHVVVADLDLEAARAVAASLPLTAMAVPCDVSSAASVEAAVRGAVEAFGRLDAVHNNAGVAHPSKPLHETTEEEWDRLMDVNLKSVYLTTRFALDALKQSRGCIVNTASMVGLMGQDSHAAYVATKGGMIALTKAMALDYALFGIRVNAICPAGVWTDMLRKWADEQENRVEIAQYLDEIHALGRCPESDVIADAAAFLLSDKARFITGCILPVSGGAELGYRRLMKTGWFTR
jgi:NAD(P)-dependent dehydrogenase (short-subunit alcohol dehydrogenase family)